MPEEIAAGQPLNLLFDDPRPFVQGKSVGSVLSPVYYLAE